MKRVFILLIGLLAVVSTVQAQEPGSLLMYFNNQFWSWQAGDAAAQPLSFCALPERESVESSMVLSPDGTQFAFRGLPELVTDAIERVVHIGGGELPTDLFICDLQTRELTRIAAQPEGAFMFDENGLSSEDLMMRGVPAWSPDGSMLTWTEFSYEVFELDLVTYDISTGTKTKIADLPLQYGVPINPIVRWGETGIALISYELTEGSDPAVSIIVYDATTGDEVGKLAFPDAFGLLGMRDIFWVDDNGSEALALMFHDEHFEVFFPETGVSERINGLEAYSQAAPDGMAMVFGAFMGNDNSWAVREGETFTMLPLADFYEAPRFAISTDGSAVAFVTEQVYIWQNGNATPVPGTTLDSPYQLVSLAWAPLEWRSYRDALPELGMSPEPITCEGFLESRLIIGARGVVRDEFPNNLRAEPSASATLLGRIPTSGEFSVLSGPVCAENLAWWHVDYNGMVGWTAEGQNGEYWLAPLP